MENTNGKIYHVGYQWVIPYNLAFSGPLSLRYDVAVNTAPFSNSSLHSYSSEMKSNKFHYTHTHIRLS
jgi:hypothetical protein